MKIRLILFLPLLAALALSSGCVTSRTPVGNKVAALKPEDWNKEWRDGDGEIVSTKIKDAKLGIVQVRTKPAWLKPSETRDILVRTLGPLTIVNQKTDGGYDFGRIALDSMGLVVFGPNKPFFASLIRKHEIVGKIEKDKHGKPTGTCIIDGFSADDYERLKREGFEARTLFDEDPSQILVRQKCMPFW